MTAVTPSRSGVSPSSSPRLPSPPPIPEVQFGPKSPGIDPTKELSLDATSKPDEGAARRIRPGTKAADMAMGPPLVPLSQLDSPFQLQEHLKSLYSHLSHTPDSTHTVPITKETALQLATPPQINDNESVDRNLWLYELCRFLTQKANIVSIFLMNDSPPCSATTCPEMRASEWQYLCAVHEPPKSCCAIDYCNHTLDWAANVLTSPKHFPSRLALGGEGGNVIQSMRQLTNIFRRVYRIFAHAWFQHRDVFWSVEATYGLYMLFKVVCDQYHLIPEDSYTIPPEAEGVREAVDEKDPGLRPLILRKDGTPSSSSEEPSSGPTSSGEPAASVASTTVSTGATTRRHKHTPSTGSHVATIAEGAEDEEEQPTSTISTKPNNVPGMLGLIDGPESLKISIEEKRAISPQPRKSGDDPSPDRLLPKLDIASTVPKYEPRAPEDPTPTGNTEDVDPLSTHQGAQQQSSSSMAKGDDEKAGTILKDEAAMKTHPETPVERVTKPFDDEQAGRTITSPSGGSIRTAGNDVLAAIMGHIDDSDEEYYPPRVAQAERFRERDDDVKTEIRGEGREEADETVEENESFSPVQTKAPESVDTVGKEDEAQKEPAEVQEQEENTHASRDELERDEIRVSVEERTEDEQQDEERPEQRPEQHPSSNPGDEEVELKGTRAE
ncbi:hypothetical protein G647_09571 [Cladophialophora carrionii CBS 160.54]|uniref:Mob1/phocein family protein n=1 Tax=Cladophialophora carrionii CBS 160.54 TaxID=1279043 RepID=V9DL63_9EURO|nr:uncharacterized protein G647_09571 [Cladophialophora carrionii CBS 160.54]ETI27381.1 hypothetical protein G647_09571 [Cladophialophora carrionii CBS 160.54]